MHFERDRAKAESNRRKHKVTFDEAVTIFHDPLAATFRDPDGSRNELRLITIGYSLNNRLLVVAHAMKRKSTKEVAEMRAEYTLDYSKAERGRYHKRLMKEGSNVVVLDRDVARAFPDSASVNRALRSVLKARRPSRLARTRDKASRA
jgi:hypothetical protein